MSPSYENILDVIYHILVLHPEGVSEYGLLQTLRKEGFKSFEDNDLLDPIILFQSHFLLFHLLYQLRDRLRIEQQGDIDIHCLNIILSPWKQSESTLPSHCDTLREYYLDLTQLEAVTRKDVEEMLSWFWEEYDKNSQKGWAFSIFKLKESASQNMIKRRYRELLFQHHPDHGGDPDHFIQIKQAAEVLLS